MANTLTADQIKALDKLNVTLSQLKGGEPKTPSVGGASKRVNLGTLIDTMETALRALVTPPSTVATGGTGAATFTAHGVLLGEGTSAIAPTAAMTNGQLLVGATGADPAPQTVGGDFTLAANGTATIANNAITSVKINAGAVTGVKVASTLVRPVVHNGVDATGGAANATVTGVATGDVLLMAFNITDSTDVTADFAATANGAGTISQTSADLSAKSIRFLFLSQT